MKLWWQIIYGFWNVSLTKISKFIIRFNISFLLKNKNKNVYFFPPFSQDFLILNLFILSLMKILGILVKF